MTKANSKVLESTVRKPPNAGKGRVKGVPNKFTGALKDMVRQALEQAGGIDYLAKQANESPAAFLSLVGKLLPAEIKAEMTGPDGGAIETNITVKFVKADSAG